MSHPENHQEDSQPKKSAGLFELLIEPSEDGELEYRTIAGVDDTDARYKVIEFENVLKVIRCRKIT